MASSEASGGQSSLSEFATESRPEPVTRTVVFPLETSREKTEKVRGGIDVYQKMLSYMADQLPSFPESEWNSRNTTMYRMVTRQFPDADVKGTIGRSAAAEVASAFQSWKSNGKPGDRPSFGGGEYLALSHQDVEVASNDRGYGIKASFIPYDPIWFHANTSDYHEEYLKRVVDGDASSGSAELHLSDDGINCHVTVTDEIEVYEPEAVSTYVGVDLGENVLFSAAVVSNDDIEHVEIESGDEFRHHRERLKRKRTRLQQKGDLRGVKDAKANYWKYTDQVTDTVSRRVVDLASEHAPAVIRLEDLTNYRESASDPIHDWPFAEFQEKICYKATAAGIPVEFVKPRNTSITCRKCGQADPAARSGDSFHCRRCQYEVHADVNAAMNIALDQRDESWGSEDGN
jgi:IS605 OrfB family transposase